MAVTFLTNEDEKKYVKTINDTAPDENGNIVVKGEGIAYDNTVSGIDATTVQGAIDKLSGGNVDQSGGGLSSTASALLITILRNGVYSTDQSANITALEAALASSGESGGGETPDDTTKTLTSISATYSGGSVPVGTSVLALTGIVVTATYDDGSTAVVTGYTLSGTIAEGSNTVTVGYGGKTTTFTVTGVAESGGDSGENSDILYELAEPTTFDGTNSITTDAVVSNVDDFSFVLDYEFEGTISTMEAVNGARTTVSGSRGLAVQTKQQAGNYKLIVGCDGYSPYIAPATGGSYFTTTGKQTVRVVATKCISNTTAKICVIINGVRIDDHITNEMPFGGAITQNVIVGGSLIGTINEFKIYNRVLSDEEIEAYLA